MYKIAQILIISGGVLMAAPRMYDKTPAGKIKVFTIPEAVVMESEAASDYFSTSDMLFGNLFRYIRFHEVSMTSPVEAEIEPGTMKFYVGEKDISKNLRDTLQVQIERIPAREVVAAGISGAYNRKNYETALSRLYE
ncbi:MAG: hypothetical protein GF350_03290 [Chitinivibrionales bacterium]|nr:hypothetical protein [Chitinivibrionales bacterium]